MNVVTVRQLIEEDYQEEFRINQRAFGRDNESRLLDKIRMSKTFQPQLSIVASKRLDYCRTYYIFSSQNN